MSERRAAPGSAECGRGAGGGGTPRSLQPLPRVLPLRRGNAVLCPGSLRAWEGTWEMRRAAGMGEQTPPRHLNGRCFRAETVAFCAGSSGL